MDRLEEWRIFTTVAALRSFSKAAALLGRSPQSVTRAVAALEDRLGTRLLNRTTRSVSLSNEGERLVTSASRVLEELDALETSATSGGEEKNAAASVRGVVSITAPILFGQIHISPIVTELLTKHPGVDAKLVLLDRVVSLAEEGIDVGVRIGALPDSSLRAKLVGHVRLYTCASPNYLERVGRPRTPEALSNGNHTCIAFAGTTPIPDRWSFRRSADGGDKNRREKSIAVHSRLTVNSGQAAIDSALAGLGLVRALSYQVDALVAGGKLTVVLRAYEPEPIPVHLVQLAGRHSTRAVTAFVDLASERLRSL